MTEVATKPPQLTLAYHIWIAPRAFCTLLVELLEPPLLHPGYEMIGTATGTPLWIVVGCGGVRSDQLWPSGIKVS